MLIILCGMIFFITIRIINKESISRFSNDSVICVLTKGYIDISDYDKLIKRNKSIADTSWGSKYKHIIFHEGNIPKEHQNYIQSNTSFELEFQNISKIFNRPFTENVSDELCTYVSHMGIGYRKMCRFWFIDFWNILQEYDYVLRLDEDIILKENCEDLIDFCKTHNYKYVSAVTMGENPAVIPGLAKFVDEKEKNILRIPGTHSQVINLKHYNTNRCKSFIRRINESGCIKKARWGDAPLMGIFVKRFTRPNEYLFKWSGFKGYHGSHNHHF